MSATRATNSRQGPAADAPAGETAATRATERPAEEVRRATAWARSILEAAPDAICVTDPEHVVTDFNARFLAVWGMTPELIARHDIEEMRDCLRRQLADPERFFQRLDEIRGSAVHETHDIFAFKDGRIFERRSCRQLIDGRAVGRVWSFRDITAQRQAEERVRDREQHLRAILGQVSIGIAVAGLDGRLQEVNRRFEEVVGRSAAELRTMSILDITHPADRAATEEMTASLLLGAAAERTMEKRYVRADGQAVWSRTTVTLIRDPQGALRHFLGVIEDITRRRSEEEAIRRNEAELRALADSMAQLAWMAEPDGHVFWYNRRWFEYTGTTMERMRGWGWQGVHDPSTLPEVMSRWRAAIRAGEPFEMEFPLRGADGVYRWFLTRAIPVRDQSGALVRWLGTSTDIHRAKRAENALREETRVLELLNRTGAAIAAELDLPDLLRTVMDSATELSGAKFGGFFCAEPAGGEARGGFALQAWAGVPPEGLEHACEGRHRFLSEIFRGGVPARQDDSPDDLVAAGFPPSRSYLAVPVVSRAGEILGGMLFGHPNPGKFDTRAERVLVGVAAQAAIAIDNALLYEAVQRDLAELARSEQRLRESETRLRVSLQTAALGTWECDVATSVVTLDERAQELFAAVATARMPLDDFLGLTHPDDLPARRSAILHLCAGRGERHEMEFRVAASGRWLKSGAKPVRNDAGGVLRVVGGVLDISDLMQARATTEERRRELERLVVERTASLQRAIEQMEEFSYSVSHDLRAPLRAIQGYAEAVLEDHGDGVGAEGQDHLRRILGAAARMDRLTREVLIYSKVARGAAPVSALSLERVVDDVIEQYAPARRRQGSITVERPLAPVLGHEPLLAQAISNLLANALKFVADGLTPQVRLWTERRGDDVRLWVEDNGIGVKPEYQGRIWGMFNRIHPGEKYEGTGIGLAIVRKAAERMGGSVGVESDGRQGSRFWIQLRAA